MYFIFLYSIYCGLVTFILVYYKVISRWMLEISIVSNETIWLVDVFLFQQRLQMYYQIFTSKTANKSRYLKLCFRNDSSIGGIAILQYQQRCKQSWGVSPLWCKRPEIQDQRTPFQRRRFRLELFCRFQIALMDLTVNWAINTRSLISYSYGILNGFVLAETAKFNLPTFQVLQIHEKILIS